MVNVNLTKGQKKVLDFIGDYFKKFNRAPYIREIQEGCGFFSYKSAVDRLMALEKKGYISRALNKHRGIEILKRPQELDVTAIDYDNVIL